MKDLEIINFKFTCWYCRKNYVKVFYLKVLPFCRKKVNVENCCGQGLCLRSATSLKRNSSRGTYRTYFSYEHLFCRTSANGIWKKMITTILHINFLYRKKGKTLSRRPLRNLALITVNISARLFLKNRSE